MAHKLHPFLLTVVCALVQTIAAEENVGASTARRVFMWMWGTAAELESDAKVAVTHSASITDMVLECDFDIKPPFDREWENIGLAKCEKPAQILHKAGIRVWLTLEPSGSMKTCAIARPFWSEPADAIPAMASVAKRLNASGWNFDFECGGTSAPLDFELYLSWLAAVRKGLENTSLEILVDANGDGGTYNYTAFVQTTGGLVLDMTTYYEAWPGPWQASLRDCVDATFSSRHSAGPANCLVGLACYKGWSQAEVQAKVDYAANHGATQLGVFTLASQSKYPEDFWWPILESYLSRSDQKSSDPVVL